VLKKSLRYILDNVHITGGIPVKPTASCCEKYIFTEKLSSLILMQVLGILDALCSWKHVILHTKMRFVNRYFLMKYLCI
jgi:hypothetical protein